MAIRPHVADKSHPLAKKLSSLLSGLPVEAVHHPCLLTLLSVLLVLLVSAFLLGRLLTFLSDGQLGLSCFWRRGQFSWGLLLIFDTSFLDPNAVRETVEQIPEVINCHYVRSRGMPGHVHIDLHLSMDPHMKLEQAGEILLQVKELLRRKFPELADVLVQIEPHKPVHLDDVPETLL